MNTYYGLNTLDSGEAFFAALMIGFFFGLALERAGFGSSRKISGIFYFTDMAVLKVMFTALVVAMLGLVIFSRIGLLDITTQIHTIKTYYGAYAVGGLIFGVGFVISGWCPGTAMVGLASGKMDALVFLIGAILGSVLFNELFPVIEPLYSWGQSTQASLNEPGLAFIYKSLGMSQNSFLLLFTAMAVLCFWGAEYVERAKNPDQGGVYFNSPFLKAFCLLLLVIAGALSLLSPWGLEMGRTSVVPPLQESTENVPFATQKSLVSVSLVQDQMDPEELADLLLARDSELTVVDIRPESEYKAFHIRGALNVPAPDLPAFMEKNGEPLIVLYSNVIKHQTQVRDELLKMGFTNGTILTGGLIGFQEKCLKPVSLRPEPVSKESANRIGSWRKYFLSPGS
jgi:rhodanese-related sulfurtransferase/uncharacterized membrane protein YedE/YeeE